MNSTEKGCDCPHGNINCTRCYGDERLAAWQQRAEKSEALVAELAGALLTIKRSGASGGVIVAARGDDHSCAWCRGMATPCPVVTAHAALAKVKP